MKTLLLTGFGLWGGERYNSSWETLRDLGLDLPPGWQAQTELLDVTWAEGATKLHALLSASDRIGAVVCFGMYPGCDVALERIAINLNDTDRPDASGKRAPSEFVVPGAAPAYWSSLPISSTLAALKHASIPVHESRSAGGFLCNFVFYHLMHRIAKEGRAIPGGFVHLPHFEDAGGLPIDDLRRAVRVIASEVVATAGKD